MRSRWAPPVWRQEPSTRGATESTSRDIPPWWPVLGICGYSGSGKTTLIERLLPRLLDIGLRVAVLKHDAHNLDVDTSGKDTDRFFRAGATVFAHDRGQYFQRGRSGSDVTLREVVGGLLLAHDLVLVEGHKTTPLPARIWVQGPEGDEPPVASLPVLASLDRDQDRPACVFGFLQEWLARQHGKRLLLGGILIGGRSRRMGNPKQLVPFRGRPFAEWVASALAPKVADLYLIGAGPVPESLASLPRLADARGVAGPLAGMVAAMRCEPGANWLFAACDQPLMTGEAIDWLLAQWRPGCWGVLPRHHVGGPMEPFCAWYDFRLAGPLATARRPIDVCADPKVLTPPIPVEIGHCWASLDAPDDLAALA